MRKKITILLPCYNEEASLPLLWAELKKLTDNLQNYEWEFLFVNDGSKDNMVHGKRNLNSLPTKIRFLKFMIECVSLSQKKR